MIWYLKRAQIEDVMVNTKAIFKGGWGIISRKREEIKNNLVIPRKAFDLQNQYS